MVSEASENDLDDTNGSINVSFIIRVPPNTGASLDYPAPDLNNTISGSDFIICVTVMSVTYEPVDEKGSDDVSPNIFESDTDTICVMRIDDVLKGELNESQLILHTNFLKSVFREGDQLVIFLRKDLDNKISISWSPISAFCLKNSQFEKYTDLFSWGYSFTEDQLRTSIDRDAKPGIMIIIKNYCRSLFHFSNYKKIKSSNEAMKLCTS